MASKNILSACSLYCLGRDLLISDISFVAPLAPSTLDSNFFVFVLVSIMRILPSLSGKSNCALRSLAMPSAADLVDNQNPLSSWNLAVAFRPPLPSMTCSPFMDISPANIASGTWIDIGTLSKSKNDLSLVINPSLTIF